MRTFLQKTKTTHPTTSAKPSTFTRAHSWQGHDPSSFLNLQRTIDNQALPRFRQSNAEEPYAVLTGTASLHFGHDFARILVSPQQTGALQTKLSFNRRGDEYEQEADRIAEQVTRMPEPLLQRACPCGGGCPNCQTNQPSQKHERLQTKRVHASDAGMSAALPSVHEVLAVPGQPLDPTTRDFMEPRFGYDFSKVRVHSGAAAERSARDMSAHAYTVGHNIVFAASRFEPETHEGRRLLAHELTHVVQQQMGPHALLQRQEAVVPPAAQPAAQPAAAVVAAPRQDYVFIMGEDRPGSGNPFYREALRYYRAHVPRAVFVADLRNLADLFDYIHANVQDPIGNLYIVSHANEDGTLSFGLDGADRDAHVTVPELRAALHPPGGGPGALASVSPQIDAQTRIHVKGCDIGRTQEMVELLDEAFGGAGTVTAPTHEQVYGFDPTLARAEEQRVRTERIAAFTATLPPVPEPPAPVDRSLRGAARRTAEAERRAAARARQQTLRQRQQAIAAEQRRIAPEIAQAGEIAGTFEALSGPLFQHPGIVLFTAADLEPEVQRLYTQLNAAQQASLVRRLVARDRRPEAEAERNGTFRQQGQRVYTRRPFTFRFTEPASLAEANRAFGAEFRHQHFRATALRPVQRQAVDGGTELTFEFEGRFSPPRQDAFAGVFTMTAGPVPADADLIAQGQAQLPNPNRYAWRVQRDHAASGTNTLTVVAERVVAYLHHGSLDPAAHKHFGQPEKDPRFFATSTFAPPPPAAPAGGTP